MQNIFVFYFQTTSKNYNANKCNLSNLTILIIYIAKMRQKDPKVTYFNQEEEDWNKP